MAETQWSPRVSGKTATLTVSAAALVVLMWAARTLGLDVPREVGEALLVLVAAVGSWALPVRTPGKYEKR